MGFAIRRTTLRRTAAEVELVRRRIADRPAAHAIVDRQHGRVAAVVERQRIFLDDRRWWNMRKHRYFWRHGETRPFAARWARTSGQSETMDFSDYGVACDAAERARDLAGR